MKQAFIAAKERYALRPIEVSVMGTTITTRNCGREKSATSSFKATKSVSEMNGG